MFLNCSNNGTSFADGEWCFHDWAIQKHVHDWLMIWRINAKDLKYQYQTQQNPCIRAAIIWLLPKRLKNGSRYFFAKEVWKDAPQGKILRDEHVVKGTPFGNETFFQRRINILRGNPWLPVRTPWRSGILRVTPQDDWSASEKIPRQSEFWDNLFKSDLSFYSSPLKIAIKQQGVP